MTPRKPTEAHRREREEPTERFTPIPVPYLILVAVLTLVGFVYMVRYAGDEGINGDMRTASALVPVAPAASTGGGAAARRSDLRVAVRGLSSGQRPGPAGRVSAAGCV